MNVTVDDVTVVVKRGPFGNSCSYSKPKLVEHPTIENKKYIDCVALCDEHSLEPGRKYRVLLDMAGNVEQCYTIN